MQKAINDDENNYKHFITLTKVSLKKAISFILKAL